MLVLVLALVVPSQSMVTTQHGTPVEHTGAEKRTFTQNSSPINYTTLWTRELNVSDGEEEMITTLILADLDGDGTQELVLTKYSGFITAVRSNGTIMWEHRFGPIKPDRIATGDVDGDGEDEIVLITDKPTVLMVEGNGTIAWKLKLASARKIPPPVLQDLDGDGKMEIVTFNDRGSFVKLLILNSDGTIRLLQKLDSDMATTPTILDLDDDGELEIVIASLYGYGNFLIDTIPYFLNVFDTQGNLEWQFNTTELYLIQTPVIIADVFGDDSLELVFDDSASRYILDKDGNVLARYLYDGGEAVQVADINGDGRYEIMEGYYYHYSSELDLPIYVSDLSNNNTEWVYRTRQTGLQQPLLIDLNGDRDIETVVIDSSGEEIHVLSGNGTLVHRQSVDEVNGDITSPIVAWDVDGDGKLELSLVKGRTIVTLSGQNMPGRVDRQPYGFSEERGISPILIDKDSDTLPDDLEGEIGTDPNSKDTDGDGMNDGYEYMNWLDPFRDDSMEDADGDGMPNLYEYQNRLLADTDDRTWDRDMDGIPNLYEYLHGLNVTVNDAYGDKDGDGMPNLYEYQNGLDASKNDAYEDVDGDGMPNIYEYQYGLDNSRDDAMEDKDSDGMPNLYEYQHGLNVTVNDAYGDKDGDGMPNLYEYQHGLDASRNDAYEDKDGDGISNLYEYQYGLNTSRDDAMEDKDGDGMSNLYEYKHGLNASGDDAMEDKDGDGIPNIYEARLFLSADNRADGIAMMATVVLSPLGLVPYIRKRLRRRVRTDDQKHVD